MRLVRGSTAILSIGSLALAVSACETTRRIGGVQPDTQSPVITLSNTARDTQDISGGLRFNVQANYNLGLKTIDLRFSGGLNGVLDTIFRTAVTVYNVAHTLTFGANSGNGGNITIIGRATDGNGNFSEDTITIFLSNVQALQITLISPTAGAVASQNRSIPIEVRAIQNSGIAKVGFLVNPRSSVSNPTTPPNDSIVFLGTLQDTVDYTDTLTVLAATGTFDVVGFAEDSAGRRLFSNVVTVTIQSAANDVTPPQVAHKINPRVDLMGHLRRSDVVGRRLDRDRDDVTEQATSRRVLCESDHVERPRCGQDRERIGVVDGVLQGAEEDDRVVRRRRGVADGRPRIHEEADFGDSRILDRADLDGDGPVLRRDRTSGRRYQR